MSEPASALPGAYFEGLAQIAQVGPRGMITLRGDLASTQIENAATGIAGVDFPAQGQANCVGDRGICWMSPDEILLLCPYAEVSGALEAIAAKLAGQHFLAANVSDARAIYSVRGKHAREVLSKLTPADLSPAAFKSGHFRRSRAAQVPAAFWMRDDDKIEVICFRSVAGYMFDLLKTAAAPGGAVGYF